MKTTVTRWSITSLTISFQKVPINLVVVLLTNLLVLKTSSAVASNHANTAQTQISQETWVVDSNIHSGNQGEAIQKTDSDQLKKIYFVGVPGDEVIECGEELPSWPLVTATDNNRDYEVLPKEQISFARCGGKIITRIWSVTDPQGVIISRKQIISYSDSTPPVLNIGQDTVLEVGDEFPLPYYEATDQGCSAFEVMITEEEYSLSEGLTSTLRKFVATDGCGNTTTRIQHIHQKSHESKASTKARSVSALEYK